MGGILSRKAGKSEFYEFPRSEIGTRQYMSSSLWEVGRAHGINAVCFAKSRTMEFYYSLVGI